MSDAYLLIAGSRTVGHDGLVSVCENEMAIDELFDSLCKPSLHQLLPYEKVHVVEGGAAGIDTNGARWARSNGYDVIEFKADWDSYGRSAGMIRNGEMVKYVKAMEKRAAVIIWDGMSKGTANTIDRVVKADIPYCIYNTKSCIVFSSWSNKRYSCEVSDK